MVFGNLWMIFSIADVEGRSRSRNENYDQSAWQQRAGSSNYLLVTIPPRILRHDIGDGYYNNYYYNYICTYYYSLCQGWRHQAIQICMYNAIQLYMLTAFVLSFISYYRCSL